MKRNMGFIRMMVVAGLLAAMAPSAGAQDKISPADAAAIAAQAQQVAAVVAVANDRAGTIGSIVNKWSSALGNAAATEQFVTTLNAASNTQLASINVATSLDQVRAILLGDKLAASAANGGIVIDSLGSLSQDLTFTPLNPPCRAFDTRFIGAGVPPAGGTVSNYQVYGASTGPQGGTANCPAPKGEPVAVSANFTVIPVGTAGHIRVYPYNGLGVAGIPPVSFVNFDGIVGHNLANSGIISTCYLCAFDLSVYNGSVTHHVGDIMGFFYPVSTSDPSFNEVKGASTASGFSTITSDGAIHMVVSPFVTHTTAVGDNVHITAMQALGSTSGASGLDLWPCYRVNSPQGSPSIVGFGSYGMQVTAGTRVPMSINGIAIPGAGTFDFGLCYRTSDVNWNNNEFGYVSTIVLNGNF